MENAEKISITLPPDMLRLLRERSRAANTHRPARRCVTPYALGTASASRMPSACSASGRGLRRRLPIRRPR